MSDSWKDALNSLTTLMAKINTLEPETEAEQEWLLEVVELQRAAVNAFLDCYNSTKGE